MSQTLLIDALDTGGVDGIATNWTAATDSGTPPVYSIATTGQRTGVGCQKIIAAGFEPGKYLRHQRDLSLSGLNYQGSTVTFTAYCKCTGIQPMVKLTVLELSAAGATLATHETSPVDVPQVWTASTLSFAVTGLTTATLRLQVTFTGPDETADVTVYLDDVLITSSVIITGYVEDDFLRNLKAELDAMLASRQTASTVPNFGRVECDIPAVTSGQFPALFLSWLSTTDGPATQFAYPNQYFERIITARIILVNGLFDKKYNEAETRKLLHAVRAWLQAHRSINGHCIDFSVDRMDSGEQAFLRSGGQVQSHGALEVTGHVLETVTAT